MATDIKLAAAVPLPPPLAARAHHQASEDRPPPAPPGRSRSWSPQGAAEPGRLPAGLEVDCGLHLEVLGRLLQRRGDGEGGARMMRPRLECWEAEQALRRELRRSSAALAQARPRGGGSGEELDAKPPGARVGRAPSLLAQARPRGGGSGEELDAKPAGACVGRAPSLSASRELSPRGDRLLAGNSDDQIDRILSSAAPSTEGYASMGHYSSHASFVGHSSWDRDERVIDQLRKPSSSRQLAKQKPLSEDHTRVEKPPRAFYTMRWLMSKPQYEMAWAFLIFCNLIVMILEVEYKGMQCGYELGGIYAHYGSQEYTSRWWPGADRAFYTAECLFAGVFTLELLITCGYDFACAYAAWPTHRAPFWKCPLDLVDLIVVVCSDVSLALDETDTAGSMQAFRILRLARLLRLIRLLRKIYQFDTLHLMTTAIKGSMGALMFSSMLLITILTLFAMVLTNMLRTTYIGEDSPLEPEKQQELFRYFGTFSRSMLSMFELALANWPTVTRFMVEELHECFGPICIVWKLSIGLAVVGVINGVFIRETFSVAESDEFIMIRSRMRQVLQHQDRMRRLFQLADKNNDGVLVREEFRRVFEKPAIKAWLEAMELRCDDADTLFALLAGSADGVISEEGLIRGIAQLKGPARNFDLLTLVRGLEAAKTPS
ncbi:unnamed protein product [Prorocentrum cordatum]|uniref:EF-hand domain-containing protein n=1 Tax=Prorocentrum cordatum TaxID=2364126 RepID=A0ABN9YFZ0_9DINO|nr:unnamed protein product [Polarella glacialis]